MTARELADLIDKQATLAVPAESKGTAVLEVAVQILDAREHFGRIDVLVTPVQGAGQAWVSAERVKV